jgi:hypothetical protein
VSSVSEGWNLDRIIVDFLKLTLNAPLLIHQVTPFN